ncbi:hypothetical protein pah_c197o107 [Parachlamydia acanthamoebae str. Hall's coccus]|nr:hypothetical protein pah_c197o107 [Parachlamydia acanthamoebae str. Hall's coccus]
MGHVGHVGHVGHGQGAEKIANGYKLSKQTANKPLRIETKFFI